MDFGRILGGFWEHFSKIFRFVCRLGFCIVFLWPLGGFLVSLGTSNTSHKGCLMVP